MKEFKYKIGEVINDRKVIKRNPGRYWVMCTNCGKIAICNVSALDKAKCKCKRNYSKRFSGKNYSNSKEKLEQIKNKYKNGIPKEEIKNWLNLSPDTVI